jgi:hypothetical protein
VVQNTATSLKGTIVVSNCDKDSISQSKNTLSNQLTQKVQSDTSNSKSQVQVNTVTELSDGTLALDYECTGVSDHNAAKNTLNNGVKQDDIKDTISKSSKTGAPQTVKSNQPSEFILLLQNNSIFR